MECTHPVVYAKKEGIYCHVCGALLRADQLTEQEKKPAETQKTGRKHKAKKTE